MTLQAVGIYLGFAVLIAIVAAFLYRAVRLVAAANRGRAEHERRSAELLEEMRREAGRR